MASGFGQLLQPALPTEFAGALWMFLVKGVRPVVGIRLFGDIDRGRFLILLLLLLRPVFGEKFGKVFAITEPVDDPLKRDGGHRFALGYERSPVQALS